MNIVYSFVGRLPPYIVETVYQCRLFFDGQVFLICDDIESQYIVKIKEMGIVIVNYGTVVDHEFLSVVERQKHKFAIVDSLGDRKQLFMRSFERFYLLRNLMRLLNLNNVLFLELDNLIYADPRAWLRVLEEKPLALMIDSAKRASTGVFYARDAIVLDRLVKIQTEFIEKTEPNELYMCEMHANYVALEKMSGEITVLPTVHPETREATVEPRMAKHFEDFGSVIFDSSAIGIYLLGFDSIHTKGKIELGRKNPWALLDCTQYDIFWQRDKSDGLRKPFWRIGGKMFSIMNLHIHSKDLCGGLSREMQPLRYRSASVKTYISSMNQIPVVWINLEHSTERFERMQVALKRFYFISTHRIEAVDGRTVDLSTIFAGDVPKAIGEKCIAACFASHIKALQYAQEQKFDKVLILEDDTGFDWISDEQLCQYLPHAFERVPIDAHFCQLGWFIESGNRAHIRSANAQGKLWIPHGCNVFGANAYIATKAGIDSVLVRVFDTQSGKLFQRISDGELFRTHTYVCTFPLFGEGRRTQSTIGGESRSNMHARYAAELRAEIETKVFQFPLLPN